MFRYRIMKNSVIATESAIIYGSIARPYCTGLQLTVVSILLMAVMMMILHEIDKSHVKKVRADRKILRELREYELKKEQEEKIGA